MEIASLMMYSSFYNAACVSRELLKRILNYFNFERNTVVMHLFHYFGPYFSPSF